MPFKDWIPDNEDPGPAGNGFRDYVPPIKGLPTKEDKYPINKKREEDGHVLPRKQESPKH